jgi:hypothetical protein
MDIRRQILNEIKAKFEVYFQDSGAIFGMSDIDLRRVVPQDTSIRMVQNGDMEISWISFHDWGIHTTKIDVVVIHTSHTQPLEYKLYPEDLQTFFFTFNFEATYLGVSLKDKCIPVKSIDRDFAKSYMKEFLTKNKKDFKKITTVICEEKKPKDIKFICYCPDIHDQNSPNHTGNNFRRFENIDTKHICFI